jgi:uncharacterized heparinase superfamily protein
MGRLTRPKTRQLAHALNQFRRKALRSVSFSNPLHALKLKGPHPLRLLGVPKDPWPGDLVSGARILAGGFICEGQILTPEGTDENSNVYFWTEDNLWAAQTLPEGWKIWLHGFTWLRDLATVTDQAAARARAEALVKGWLKRFDKWEPLAWRADILARRLISWMAYAPLILSTNDHVYRSLVLNSLARQSRHLLRSIDDAPLGPPQISACIGLIYAGLFLPNAPRRMKRGVSELTRQLQTQVLADGGMITRNPMDLYITLRDLVALREAFIQMHREVPGEVQGAIDRMGPMLRSLCHGDGKLSLFNGSFELNAAEIREILARIGDVGDAFGNAPHSGFQRLARGQTVVIADIGPPSPMQYSCNDHAGTLSFELSDGPDRIIVNCGSTSSLPEGRPSAFRRFKASSFNLMSRATAAHSTLVVNDTNSSEVLENGLIGDGPTLVEFDRHDDSGGSWLEASHNSYEQRFGLVHKRRFFLDLDGGDLRGEDTLVRRGKHNRVDHFDIRFHLHPRISAAPDEDGNGVTLSLPSGRRWHFWAKGGKPQLDESLYLGHPHEPVKTRHIVVSGEVGGEDVVINWSLKRLGENEVS